MHPIVPLSQVATPVTRRVVVTPGTCYRTIGVKWWGEGVYERSTIDGSQTAATTLSTVRKDDLIINKIWVRHGSIAVVPPDIDGCVGSNEFPTFRLACHAVLPRWVHWLTKTKAFWDQCAALSRGTSGKDRIRPELFLTVGIPLPPLEEQRRIVARIEELAEKIDVASTLQESTSKETQVFLTAEARRVFDELEVGHGATPLGTLAPHVTSGPRDWARKYSDSGFRFYRAQDIAADGSVSQANAVHVEPPATTQGRSALLETGDLMLVITGATVGRVAVFSDDCAPGFVSQHVAICRLPADRCLPRYVWWSLRAPRGRQQLMERRYGQGKPGLNLTSIRSLAVPLPSLDEQHMVVNHLDNLWARTSALSLHQSAVRDELDALLPSILDKAFKGEL